MAQQVSAAWRAGALSAAPAGAATATIAHTAAAAAPTRTAGRIRRMDLLVSLLWSEWVRIVRTRLGRGRRCRAQPAERYAAPTVLAVAPSYRPVPSPRLVDRVNQA
ncbi:hypothetical protein GCM10018787_51030 [Streptomyces thermodiastaticus]|nr:hypothetical protein GCM10018787_51030 [Streptomyces thermodiastaticus]